MEQPKDVDIETTLESIEKLQDDDAPVEEVTEVLDTTFSEAVVAEGAEADAAVVTIEEAAADPEDSSKETAADVLKKDDAAEEEHNDESPTNKI